MVKWSTARTLHDDESRRCDVLSHIVFRVRVLMLGRFFAEFGFGKFFGRALKVGLAARAAEIVRNALKIECNVRVIARDALTTNWIA